MRRGLIYLVFAPLPWTLLLLMGRRDFIDGLYYVWAAIPTGVLLVLAIVSLRANWRMRPWRYVLCVACLSYLLFLGWCLLVFAADWSFHPS